MKEDFAEVSRPPYSLLTLILLITIVVVGISHVSTTYRLQQANDEIQRLKHVIESAGHQSKTESE